MSDQEHLHYWLATSAVEFTGTHTTTVPAHGGATADEYHSDASLTTRADLVQPAVALAVKDHFADSKISLGLTDDGRLTSSALESLGEGAILLGSAASLVTSAVADAAAAAKIVAAQIEEGGEAAEEPFARQDLLDDLTRSENDLAARLVSLAAQIAGSDGGTPRPAAPGPEDLSALSSALELVSQQRDRLTKEKVAWESAGHTVSKASSYTLDVADLPTGSHFNPHQEMADAAKKVWADLGVMTSVVDDHEPQAHPIDNVPAGDDAPFQPGAEDRLWYRLPRRVRLDMWKKTEDGPPELVRSSHVEIIDKHCPHLSLPLGSSGWFGRDTVSVKMGALGTPVLLSSDRDPGLANAATALAKVPTLISTGITDASGIATAWQALDPSAASRQTAALQAQKNRLQLVADITKLGGSPEA